MPRIELRDAIGTVYRCDTLSLERLRDWLGEWLPRLFPPDWTDTIEPVVSVWPLWNPESNLPDWPTDTRVIGELFTIPRDPGKAMIALKAKHRELIERREKLRAADKERTNAHA